jgi:D-alanyl-lipoteichoic acid acyltransferase DltB (MBOAT superfamily)
MLFNSLQFAVFLPLVVVAYYAMPARWRWTLLLGASYYFYGSWRWEYLILIVVSTLIDYSCGLLLDAEETPWKRKLLAGISIATNIGILVVFKYLDFLISTVNQVTAALGAPTDFPLQRLLLPIGISFYSFQTLSYTLDVYRRRIKAERHLGYFALFVTYFPQLVAGPIERADRLLPSLREEAKFSWTNLSAGSKLLIWGFFKKLMIADRLGLLVDHVWTSPEKYPGFPLILAAMFFGFQIYCDFSAYSDIARGAARLMGVELMVNFKAPFFSRSIAAFWSRWHISLSSWFRDYVYIPLGGNRRGEVRSNLNVMAVFLASGLWHGANWTYIIWGGIHGVVMLLQRLTAGLLWSERPVKIPRLRAFTEWAITFATVTITWFFFRSESISKALYMMRHSLDAPGYLLSIGSDFLLERSFLFRLGLTMWEFYIALAALLLLFWVEWKSGDGDVNRWTAGFPVWARHGFFAFIMLFTLMFGQFVQREFIYFQF